MTNVLENTQIMRTMKLIGVLESFSPEIGFLFTNPKV